MIVYGDRATTTDTADFLGRIAAGLRATATRPGGLDRHAGLVAALVATGELLQGVADADLAARGVDAPGAGQAACTALLMAVAEAVFGSWDRRFVAGPLPDAVVAAPLPRTIERRLAEGYAHYALYPEAYIAAARRLRLDNVRVIGIRSIGTALAAIVAVVLGAPPPLTLRPTGPPFRREIHADVVPDPAATYVIVDEGPGLSGSSFAAVAAWLAGHGVAADRIVFMPGHDGAPGACASAAIRDRWRVTPRAAADAPALLRQHLPAWVETVLGPPDAPLQDISGGAWRRLAYPDPADWPPIDGAQERPKFIAFARGRRWLVRFAGLGEEGVARLALARQLFEHRLVPRPLGLAHGFLVEAWHDDRLAVEPSVATVARYLGLRARLLPAAGAGATLTALFEMARVNAAEALGAARAAALEPWRARLPELAARVRPVAIDGRCQRHEWLVLPGRTLKADALDHHRGHDLIGCQDIAWDVAGAAIELDLAPVAAGRLRDATAAAAGRPVDAELVAFLRVAYAAFRLGAHTMTADAQSGWLEEAVRNAAAAAHFAVLLDGEIDGETGGVRARRAAGRIADRVFAD